jgi:exonuclease III
MSIILLLLCGDIESCPGPIQDELGSFLNTKGMKIVHQNVRGLFNNLLGLQELIERHGAVDIMTVSERHIVDDRFDDNDHLYKIPGYVFIYRNRKHGLGGGVAMYIKESVNWERRYDLENDGVEGIWIEVFVKNSKSFLLATCYRPPDGSNYLPSDFNDNLNVMLGDGVRESKEIIMLGDFNVNYLKKNEHMVFKDLFRRYGFQQIIKKATRTTYESSTLIDLIMTNHPGVISKHCVYPASISDHDMVGCALEN